MFEEDATAEEVLNFLRWDSERTFVYRSREGYRQKPMGPTLAPQLPSALLRDRAFIEQAVALCGDVLMQTDAEFRDDKRLILLAAPTCWPYRFKIKEEYYSDREFMLELLSANGELLMHLKDTDDRELIFAAVRNNFEAAVYIDYDLLRDREFVKELVRVHGRTLRYVDDKFRDDEEIVLLSLGSYRAFEYASGRLRNSEEFVKKVLEINPSCLAYAPASFRTDRGLVLKLMDVHPYVYRYAKGALKEDVSLALLLLKKDVSLFHLVPPPLDISREVEEELLRQLNDGATTEDNRKYIGESLDWIKRARSARKPF